MREWLMRLLRRFGRPPPDEEASGAHQHVNLERFDSRLNALERKEGEQDLRLRILEKQGNPWGIGRE